MNYHPTIQLLDTAASLFHEKGMMRAKNDAFQLAGEFQQELLAKSPYPKNRRYVDRQWVWALGHIGLLHQLIRWFRHNEPETQLILEASGSANDHFLVALAPFLMIVETFSREQQSEAVFNAVYFGCPDGVRPLVTFYKMVERECEGEWVLHLSDEQLAETSRLLFMLDIKRPYIALQPRKSAYDPGRNATLDEMNQALEKYPDHSIVVTGLDPSDLPYPSVQALPDPLRGSFLLSAACDQFVGSNSGAWTVPHAYQRPVEIVNDWERAAWIYP